MSTNNIIVEFAAGEQLSTSAWATLVTSVVGKSNAEVVTFVKAQEEEYRSLTEATRMPSTWRSAKAVILRALSVGIVITNGVGKTALEKLIRTVKAEAEAKTETERNRRAEFVRLWNAMDDDDKDWVKGYIGA